MKNIFIKLLIFLSIFSIPAYTDPWLTGKDEFIIKKLEYLSIKNKFSIDSSAYPIPLALIRNPNEDMFNNINLMNEYIDFANSVIQEEAKNIINE